MRVKVVVVFIGDEPVEEDSGAGRSNLALAGDEKDGEGSESSGDNIREVSVSGAHKDGLRKL